MPKLNQFVFAFCGHKMSGNLSTDIFEMQMASGRMMWLLLLLVQSPCFHGLSLRLHMLKGKELSSTISPLCLRNGYTSSSVHIITTAMTNFLENFHMFVQVILYKIAAHFTAISSFLDTTCKELHLINPLNPKSD